MHALRMHAVAAGPAAARGSGGERKTAHAHGVWGTAQALPGPGRAELPRQGAWPHAVWEEGQSLVSLFS